MFEGRDDVMPVAAQRAMVSIMQHHDVAPRPARTRDAREPLDQSLRRLRIPIPANFRPHDHALHSRPAHFAAEQRAAVTVRRPHPARRSSHGGGNRGLASLQLVANSRPRLKNQIRMRIRVIAKQVAADRHFLNQPRTFPYKFPDQKKCCRNGIAIKQVEELRGDGWVGAIVKCEGDFFCRCRVPHGWPVQLRRRSNSSPRGDSRSGYRACRHDHGPWIQCVTAINLRTTVPCVPAALRAVRKPLPEIEFVGNYTSRN